MMSHVSDEVEGEVPISTTDGAHPSDEEDRSEQKEEVAEKPAEVDPEALIQRNVAKMRGTLDKLEALIRDNQTDSVPFRNEVLDVVNHYYIKRNKLTLQQLGEVRCRQAKMLADSPALEVLCRKVYEAFQKYGKDRFIDPDSEGSKLVKGPFKLLSYMTTICQNFADQSEYFAIKLSNTSDILELCRGMMTDFLADHLDGKLHKEVDKRLRQTLSIVYNLLFKRNSDIFYRLQDYKFAELAEPYVASKDDHFRFTAYLVVIFGSTEEEAQQKAVEDDAMLQFLLKHLALAYKNTEKRSKGYHVVELAKCTHQFSLVEQHKPLLLRLNVLQTLQLMLDPANEDAEIESALSILLSLSFDKVCAAAIKEQCRPELRTLRADKKWEQHKLLASLIFVVDDDKAAAAPAPPPGLEAVGKARSSKKKAAAPPSEQPLGHVMISYHQRTKPDVVKWVREQLKKHNVQVWIDYEQMEDSTLDAMAKAVEGSLAVLMCVSKGYKDSDYCRMEAEYAMRNRKPLLPLLMEEKYRPDGWLGFIMGSQRYYDFSGRKNETDMLNDLLRALQKWLSSDVPAAIEPVRAPRVNAKPEAAKTFATWTAEQVKAWIVDKQLPSHLEPLELDGRHLQFLVNLQGTAPEAFYRMLAKGLQLTMFHHVFDFVQALGELNK